MSAHTPAQRRRRRLIMLDVALLGTLLGLGGLGLYGAGHLIDNAEPSLPDCRAGMVSRCAGTTPQSGIGSAISLAATTTTRPHYAEDDPRFDCRLDGNRICGTDRADTVQLPDGTLTTTDPRHAAELVAKAGAVLVSAER